MFNALPRSALCQWKEKIASCRDARLESEDQAWQRLAEWYGEWVRYNHCVVQSCARQRFIPTARR